MAPDSLEQRLPGTIEETADGVRIRYEERNADGAVVTVTSLDMADGGVVLTRMGEVTSEMAFAEGKEHTSFYAVPYGTLPVAVKAESVKWKLDEDGGMLALRYAITIGGQRGKCALRIRVRTEE